MASFETNALDERPVLLVLDDEPNITRALFRQLRHNYRVLIANDPRTAFELLARNEVQVIICDQRMPELSGVEFLCRARESYPHAARLILSAYADQRTVDEAIGRGCIDTFLGKPWEHADLLAHLDEACRQYRRRCGQDSIPIGMRPWPENEAESESRT